MCHSRNFGIGFKLLRPPQKKKLYPPAYLLTSQSINKKTIYLDLTIPVISFKSCAILILADVAKIGLKVNISFQLQSTWCMEKFLLY